jgi:drug/metabolite transporter (DMT)-like permease
MLWGRRACGVGPPCRRQREKRYSGPKLKNRGGPACQPYALGVLNPFLYYQVLFNAYDLLPAQQTAPLTFSWAITLALLSVPLLGQRIGIKSFAALLISYTGVLVISTKGDVLGLVFVVVGNLMQQFTDFTGRFGAWYDDRLSPSFRGRTAEEAATILGRLGLRGAFWRP